MKKSEYGSPKKLKSYNLNSSKTKKRLDKKEYKIKGKTKKITVSDLYGGPAVEDTTGNPKRYMNYNTDLENKIKNYKIVSKYMEIPKNREDQINIIKLYYNNAKRIRSIKLEDMPDSQVYHMANSILDRAYNQVSSFDDNEKELFEVYSSRINRNYEKLPNVVQDYTKNLVDLRDSLENDSDRTKKNLRVVEERNQNLFSNKKSLRNFLQKDNEYMYLTKEMGTIGKELDELNDKMEYLLDHIENNVLFVKYNLEKKIKNQMKIKTPETYSDYTKNLAIRRGYDSWNNYKTHLRKNMRQTTKREIEKLRIYETDLAKENGFKSILDYANFLARQNGFKSIKEHRIELAKESSFESVNDLEKYLAEKRGFKSVDNYRKYLTTEI